MPIIATRVQDRQPSLPRRFEPARSDLIAATYEEWQRNALASTPKDNGRIATVLFRREEERLRWLHLQETWLPDERMRAGPFDF